MGAIWWHRRETRRTTENTNFALKSGECPIYSKPHSPRDLEIQHEEGSRLTRLVKVLQDMAKTDEKLANVLRNFSLL
jgi:hypothetical protein